MKVKLKYVLEASRVFKLLMEKRFSNFSISYKIANAAKDLDGKTAFFLAEQKKLIEAYADKDPKTNQVVILKNGQISFPFEESKIDYIKAIEKLRDTEVDIFDSIEIKVSDLKDGEMDLSPSEIISLEPFIKFTFNNDSEQGETTEPNC